MRDSTQAAQCVAPAQHTDGTLEPCTGSDPAECAGLRVEDVIEKINDTKIISYSEVVSLIDSSAEDDIKMTTDRNGSTQMATVTPEVTKYKTNDDQDIDQPAIGIAFQQPKTISHECNVMAAIGGAASFTGSLFGTVWNGLPSVPEKVSDVVASVFGAQRDPANPVSVVGASHAGGELAEINQRSPFFLLLANLNYFLVVLNLVSLPLLGGGHITVVIYEYIRDLIRRTFGKPALGSADCTELTPTAMTFTAVLLVFGALIMTADVVNPAMPSR